MARSVIRRLAETLSRGWAMERYPSRLARVLLLAFAVAAVAASGSAHPPGTPLSPEEAAIARQVLAVRDQIRTLVEARDAKGLRDVYTDDFSHTHGSAKVDGRDSRVVTLLAGEPAIELSPVDELLVRVHGAATAIVSGRSPIRSLADGKIYDFRWTQVFVKVGERWQLAVSQATRVPPPAP
jgi:ketosteroid isomerase-like protein